MSDDYGCVCRWNAHRERQIAECASHARLRAEVERLRADLLYEQERNRNNVASYSASLREWREAESSPDCVACCTLDAALAESEVKRG